jgi:hypothetical protein
MSWSLAGVAIDSAGIVGGTELTPAALRKHSRLQRMVAVDHGDLVTLARQATRPAQWAGRASRVVAATGIIRRPSDGSAWRRTVVPGGCCTLMIGLGAATRDKVGRSGSPTSTAT